VYIDADADVDVDVDVEMCNELKDQSNMNLQRKGRLAARSVRRSFGFPNLRNFVIVIFCSMHETMK
jgi:hypothetical protein